MANIKDNRPGVPSNLTNYRYQGDRLSAGDEADLVRAAKQGDAVALDQLTKACQPMVGKLAHKYYGESTEEIISLLNFGLARAIHGFDSRKNVRFGTYAYHCMEGSFLDEKKGTTAADRAVFAHPSASVEELIEFAGYSTATPVKAARARRLIEEALAKQVAASTERVSYDTTEPGADDENGGKPQFVASGGGFDPVEGWHRRRDRQITAVIQLAVWISETTAMRELAHMGRPAYALKLCERARAKGVYVEVKRAPRIKRFSEIRDREWAAVGRYDSREYERRVNQRMAETRAAKEAKRLQDQAATRRKINKGIRKFLSKKGLKP